MNDIQRDLGRLEGTVTAQGERIDALDAKIDANHTATNHKLDQILHYQAQQKGAKRFGVFLAGAVGTAAGLVVSWFKSS